MNFNLSENKIISYEVLDNDIKIKLDNDKIIEIEKQESYVNLLNSIVENQQKNINIEKKNKILNQQATNKASIIIMFTMFISSMLILTASKNIFSSLILVSSLILLMVSILKYFYNKLELKLLEKSIINNGINKNKIEEEILTIELETENTNISK